MPPGESKYITLAEGTTYAPSPLREIADRLLVAKSLREIFDHCEAEMARRLAADASLQ
ncbi:MAG TPA: hypothetical protein VMV27_10110 [Candidatus Binataceae bacterium]|nr:hypothetical protein [Candidatus Binataceae bacterium]